VNVAEDFRSRVDALPWYHTLDLPGGVATRGYVDTRELPDRIPFPKSLSGKRCLDIGTQNGFWAFEMERRGAAGVTAIDVADGEQLDWPLRSRILDRDGDILQSDHRDLARECFDLAHYALGSSVEWRNLSVYDLAPEETGEFDFCFIGSLLLHLRDPVRALSAIRGVCTGELVVFDQIDLRTSVIRPRAPRARLDGTRVWWWTPNASALVRMVEAAGWRIAERTRPVFVPTGAGFRKLSLVEAVRASGIEGGIGRLRGAPHVAIRAEPL
jgi:tRNA (mo5U34)-methyltransferase